MTDNWKSKSKRLPKIY